MLLKNYILITHEDSEEAFQQKLGMSAFCLICFYVEIIFHCPPAERVARRSFGKKRTVAATINLGLCAPALYEATREGTPGGYWGLGSDQGKAGCEWAGSGEGKT